MGILKNKLKGTTLVETIVSMMLIVLIMSIIFQSLFQINREVGSDIKPYAYFLVKQNLDTLIADEKFTELKDYNSSVTITRSLTQYENFDDLFVLEVKAIDSEGREIITSKRIISGFEMGESNSNRK